MVSAYDAEQQLLPLSFAIVAGEESVANWSWFMQWLRKNIVGHSKKNNNIRPIFHKYIRKTLII
jgi:hypothetical protein